MRPQHSSSETLSRESETLKTVFSLLEAPLSLLKYYLGGPAPCFGGKGNCLKMGLGGKHRWASRRLVHGCASASGSGGELTNPKGRPH